MKRKKPWKLDKNKSNSKKPSKSDEENVDVKKDLRNGSCDVKMVSRKKVEGEREIKGTCELWSRKQK